MTLSNDPVDHPAHYTQHPSGVEAIDVTEHFNFNRGNAIKYIWRAELKGKELEDLKKARFYLDREIKRLELATKPVCPSLLLEPNNVLGPPYMVGSETGLC